ncbi:MAG: acetyl-CoA carboxylase biotin carboxyl carrier protein [Solirubrobacterales bacterium]
MNKIRITDTTLRDAHQSLWATRMAMEDMLPILSTIDDVGYHSLEVWGGATFDVAMRYLNEDPWERLRIIRQHVKKTRLQMLLRGQSLVGYMHYPDDIVYKFVENAAKNGIDIFRIFDALNDIRNLAVPMKAAKEAGKHVQACVVYTISPVHTMDYFVDTAHKLVDLGADSICIKDMAGLLGPYQAFELVKALKKGIDIPVQLHTHYIGGLAVGACMKAAEAGVDVVDAASVPLAFGASQPPVETLVRVFQDTSWDTGLNMHQLFDIATYFEDLRKKRGFERGVTRISAMKVFEHQVPGGMISNLVSQLEEQKASDKLDLVLEEIPRVRHDLGYPPLVTPTSQIVGIQAVLNVLMGERYKMCTNETKQYVRGFYGKATAPISDEIRKLIIGDEPVISERPADLLEPGWEKAVEETKGKAESEEDVVSYALFPQVALKFFEQRKNGVKGPAAGPSEARNGSKPVVKASPVSAPSMEGEEMNLDQIRSLIKMLDESTVAELQLENQGFKLSLRKALAAAEASASAGGSKSRIAVETEIEAELEDEDLVTVMSPMVGTFYRSPAPDAPPFVDVGNLVEPGQTLCIVEAMKLMNEIKSEVSGRIVKIVSENGQAVEFGQALFLISME